MLLNLSDQSSESLQSQISTQIRARILSGVLEPEDSLASIRAFARDHRVSVITVQRAYEHLEREGLIFARRGKGFFVLPLGGERIAEIAAARLRERLQPVVDGALADGLDRRSIRAALDELLKARR